MDTDDDRLARPVREGVASAERERAAVLLRVRVCALVAEREPTTDADAMLREPDGEPLARGLREALIDVDADRDSAPVADALTDVDGERDSAPVADELTNVVTV